MSVRACVCMRVLQVLSLQGAYHGDTLGAMDCTAPSPFNGRRQTPWYAGRGAFLDPPYVAMVAREWRLTPPEWLTAAAAQQPGDAAVQKDCWAWDSAAGLFDLEQRRGCGLPLTLLCPVLCPLICMH